MLRRQSSRLDLKEAALGSREPDPSIMIYVLPQEAGARFVASAHDATGIQVARVTGTTPLEVTALCIRQLHLIFPNPKIAYEVRPSNQ